MKCDYVIDSAFDYAHFDVGEKFKHFRFNSASTLYDVNVIENSP